jgi:clan AA aspartic protease (TIGR02281 family)
MTSWGFVIIIGCAVVGFVAVSFLLEAFGGQRNDGSVEGAAAGGLPAPRKRMVVGFGLILLLMVGYAVTPSDLWNTGTQLFESGSSVLVQRADIARSRDGHFSVVAQVNGSRIAFVIDTGASTVTLTQDAAKAARLPLDDLKYSVDIETANGQTRAAAITLDTLTVGGIIEHSVSALVAQPGQLKTNLLGLSFLNRLKGWEVHEDTLIMRGYP